MTIYSNGTESQEKIEMSEIPITPNDRAKALHSLERATKYLKQSQLQSDRIAILNIKIALAELRELR